MFCPFCGSENRQSKKFCRQCGRTVPSSKPSKPSMATSRLDQVAVPWSDSQPDVPDLNNAATAPIQAKPAPPVASMTVAPLVAPVNMPPPIAPASKNREGAVAELEDNWVDEFNEMTQPLLPDTVGFESPKEVPAFLNDSDKFVTPAIPKAFNSPKVEALHQAIKSTPVKSLAEIFGEEDHPTDELEVLMDRTIDKSLDKTADIPLFQDHLDKTADIPVLQGRLERTADIARDKTRDIPIEQTKRTSESLKIKQRPIPAPSIVHPSSKVPFANYNNPTQASARPAITGLLADSASFSSMQKETSETERKVLIVVLSFALVGVLIILWALVLRPMGIF